MGAQVNRIFEADIGQLGAPQLMCLQRAQPTANALLMSYRTAAHTQVHNQHLHSE